MKENTDPTTDAGLAGPLKGEPLAAGSAMPQRVIQPVPRGALPGAVHPKENPIGSPVGADAGGVGPEAFRSARAARARVQAASKASGGAGPFADVDAPSAVALPPQEVDQSDDVPGHRAAGTVAKAPRQDEDALTQTIRRWARPTTLEELSNRGVRKVRTVSMSRVAALLEKAVNRALIERTLESHGDEALSLSSTARDEFLKLSRAEVRQSEVDEDALPSELLETRPLHERATSTLDRLRKELEGRRKLLEQREKQLSDGDFDEEEDTQLGHQMRELFAIHAGVDDRKLEKSVLSLVIGELKTSRRRARLARLEEHQREIGTLERRIAKLSVLLGETEDALRRVSAGEQLDHGVSSIFDAVQGLGRDDQQYEHKVELMKTLFEANMALRT